MNEAENKIKEYIDKGYEILKETQPNKDVFLIIDVISVAQMLQREEHFNSNNTPHTK